MKKIKTKIGSILFKKPFYGNSMIHGDRLVFLCSLLEKTLYEGIEGDVVEFGVYKGGSLISLGKVMKKLDSDKILYGLDTFEGHPYTDEGTTHVKGHLNSDFNKVNKRIIEENLSNIRLIKGMFCDNFIKISDRRFCFAHIDCDLYKSYIEVLNFILPRMNKGGIIYFDDYNSKSAIKANKAIHEFIDKKDLVILPDKQAYYIEK